MGIVWNVSSFWVVAWSAVRSVCAVCPKKSACTVCACAAAHARSVCAASAASSWKIMLSRHSLTSCCEPIWLSSVSGDAPLARYASSHASGTSAR